MRILIIEDNPGDLTLMGCYLKAALESPELVSASNFTAAKTILQKSGESFDLVFLDLSLPELEADSLINAIIALCPDCPVIAMCGYTYSKFKQKSLERGIAGFIIKDDITPAKLYDQIMDCIEIKKGISE
ncbi:MAG: response regulator [Pedobacter sp.]|nr:response regulator [Pedobacter sp.]